MSYCVGRGGARKSDILCNVTVGKFVGAVALSLSLRMITDRVKGFLAIGAACILLPLGSILVRYSKRHPSAAVGDKQYGTPRPGPGPAPASDAQTVAHDMVVFACAVSFTVQTLAELTKAVISLSLYLWFRPRGDVSEAAPPVPLWPRCRALVSSASHFFLPAFLYLVDNNIFYGVMRMINPSTFQLMSNIKIVFVAVLCWGVLNKHLTAVQWAALVLLVVGLVVSELDYLHDVASPCSAVPPASTPSAAPSHSVLPAVAEKTSILSAFLLVATMALCSALGNILVEYLYKRDPTTNIFLQNTQLYSFGVVLNFICIFVYDAESVVNDGFFVGFDGLTWLIIVTNGVTGIAVAFILRYSDNIGNVWAHAAGMESGLCDRACVCGCPACGRVLAAPSFMRVLRTCVLVLTCGWVGVFGVLGVC